MQTNIKKTETFWLVCAISRGKPAVVITAIDPGLGNFNNQKLIINPAKTF